jgi:hypothetical protein
LSVVGRVPARKWAQKMLLLAVSAAALSVPTVAAAATAAGATGTLSFLPASGIASSPLTAVSTGVCSDPRGTNLQLEVIGKGFPPGTNVTPNLAAHVYPVDPSTGGYDVPLQDTLQHFAAQMNPPASLSGRYEFTLVCKKPWGKGIYNTYRGALWFSSATNFRSLTVASSPRTPVAVSPSPAATRPTPVTVTPHVSKLPAGTTPAPTITFHPTSKPQPTSSPTHTLAISASATTGRPAPVITVTSASAATPPATGTSSPTATSPNNPAAASEPAASAGAPTKGRGSSTGRVAGLLAGSLAVAAGLGLLVRRRMARYGRQ